VYALPAVSESTVAARGVRAINPRKKDDERKDQNGQGPLRRLHRPPPDRENRLKMSQSDALAIESLLTARWIAGTSDRRILRSPTTPFTSSHITG
jgi:hypothetical protein